MEEANPRLKEAFMEIVENQLRDNDPPEATMAFERLVSEGISKGDAKIYIGQAICVEVWDAMKNGNEFNLDRYKRNLKNLPDEPGE